VTGPTDPRDDRIATPSTNAAPPDGRALATEERPQPDAPERKIGDGSKWDCPNEQHETQAHERPLISKWCPDCEHALRVKLEAELREAREEREGLRTAWHAEIRASAIIDKAAADAMVSTVREAHDLRAQLAARDALLADLGGRLAAAVAAIRLALGWPTDDAPEGFDWGDFCYEAALSEGDERKEMQDHGMRMQKALHDVAQSEWKREEAARDLVQRVKAVRG
jgi:hypothetical protein